MSERSLYVRLVLKLQLNPHVGRGEEEEGLLCGFKASRPIGARCTYSPASHWLPGVEAVTHGAALSINTTRGQALTNACAPRSSACE